MAQSRKKRGSEMQQGAPDISSLVNTLRAQEATLSELSALRQRQADTIAGIVSACLCLRALNSESVASCALRQRQADTIAGIVVVLRALIDIVLDEEQRATLETHLNMTVAGDVRGSRQAIIEVLLD